MVDAVVWLRISGYVELTGFVSSVISIIGLPLAIWKAWAAQSSADRAVAAAEALRRRVASTDVIATLAGVVGRLEDVERLDAEDMRALGQAKRELIGLGPERRILDQEQLQRVQAAVSTFREIESYARQIAEGTLSRRVVEPLERLSERRDDLRALLVELRQCLTEVQK